MRIFHPGKFFQMQLKEIPVTEIKNGTYFKQNTKQRRFRYAAKVIDWKEGDTELLRGKRLIIQEDCKQIVVPVESTVLIPA